MMLEEFYGIALILRPARHRLQRENRVQARHRQRLGLELPQARRGRKALCPLRRRDPPFHAEVHGDTEADILEALAAPLPSQLPSEPPVKLDGVLLGQE